MAAAVLVLGFFLYSARGILNPVVLFFVLWAVTFLTLFIGGVLTVPLMVIVGIAWLVLTVIASIKANQGERYRYPFTLRLVK